MYWQHWYIGKLVIDELVTMINWELSKGYIGNNDISGTVMDILVTMINWKLSKRCFGNNCTSGT